MLFFFVTAYNTNPSPIVDIHPYDYINKPFDTTLLYEKVNSALITYEQNKNIITFFSDRTLTQVDTKDISYIESLKHHTYIHTCFKVYKCNLNLSELEKTTLNTCLSLIRIHKSFIVNMHFISHLSSTELTLKTGEHIPIGRTYRQDFLNHFNRFIYH